MSYGETKECRMTANGEHAFTIPVEWKQVPNSQDGFGDTRFIDQQKPITTKVTKLRCKCGNEVAR